MLSDSFFPSIDLEFGGRLGQMTELVAPFRRSINQDVISFTFTMNDPGY